MNVGSEEAHIKIQKGTTLSNTNRWTEKMKVKLLKIGERQRNRGHEFKKRMNEKSMG